MTQCKLPMIWRAREHRDSSPFYFTIAFTTVCHFVPAVFTAMIVKRCDLAVRLSDVFSTLLLVSEYSFTPSTHTSMRDSIPVMVAAACTATGELTVAALAGLHTCTPAGDGAD